MATQNNCNKIFVSRFKTNSFIYLFIFQLAWFMHCCLFVLGIKNEKIRQKVKTPIRLGKSSPCGETRQGGVTISQTPNSVIDRGL